MRSSRSGRCLASALWRRFLGFDSQATLVIRRGRGYGLSVMHPVDWCTEISAASKCSSTRIRIANAVAPPADQPALWFAHLPLVLAKPRVTDDGGKTLHLNA